MNLPLHMDGPTIRDATGDVVVSAINPLMMSDRAELVRLANGGQNAEGMADRLAGLAEALRNAQSIARTIQAMVQDNYISTMAQDIEECCAEALRAEEASV